VFRRERRASATVRRGSGKSVGRSAHSGWGKITERYTGEKRGWSEYAGWWSDNERARDEAPSLLQKEGGRKLLDALGGIGLGRLVWKTLSSWEGRSHKRRGRGTASDRS